MARIVIATLGSLGDLYPYLTLATGLQARGHRVTIAANPELQARTEAAGIAWRQMRPGKPNDPAVFARVMHPRTGPEYAIRHLLAPAIRDSYADLAAAAASTDLLISSNYAFAAPLLAAKEGVPWVSAVLQPVAFLSAIDPPVLTQAPHLTAALRGLGRVFGVPFLALARAVMRGWGRPIEDLRAELGLDVPGPNPFWEGQHAPDLVLALFPRALGRPQPDWPAQARVTGALFWDGTEADRRLTPELEQFLAAGPPPIVFTLGSLAIYAADRFYAESLAAARKLGRRALLLVGPEAANRAQLPDTLPADAFALDYAPHAALFPRAAAIVHQGGAGTLAQAMRAGKPMLIVPFSHDQPDNAARAKRLGIARSIPARRYRAGRAARALRHLLHDPETAAKVDLVGQLVRGECGLVEACDLIERALTEGRRAS